MKSNASNNFNINVLTSKSNSYHSQFQYNQASQQKKPITTRNKHGNPLFNSCLPTYDRKEDKQNLIQRFPILPLQPKSTKNKQFFTKHKEFPIENRINLESLLKKRKLQSGLESEQLRIDERKNKTLDPPLRKSISLDDFEIGELLGKGAQASAKLVLHKQTGTIFCLRTVNRQTVEENLQKFIESLKIQMFISHPNVVKVYAVFIDRNTVNMVTEYCHDGNLKQNLFDYKGESEKSCEILLKMAQAVQHLHENSVQHRDLKLENVLLNLGVPKICDFQLSVCVRRQRSQQRRTICGSPAYFSPQMLSNLGYNRKADIWCLGIMFYEVLCGYFPFEVKDKQDFSKITEGNIKMTPKGLNPVGRELLWRMLEVDSNERLDAGKIISHPFFDRGSV